MSIGPFSLMTKLLADPITPLALAGSGLTAGEDGSILLAERALALAEMAVVRSVCAQIRAGARAMLICEPAANRVYLSPRQIEAGSDIFERFVIQPHLRLKSRLDAGGVDLIFHDCGELTRFMVRQFAERLEPAILSFGSSRCLWEDAALVPKTTVLFGNLPTKSFYSDAFMPLERVQAITEELLARMRAAGHPHILGSECDVLHVPEAGETIRRKVAAVLTSRER
jgi:uroporphyrinogen-III decarboxylase